MGIITYLNPNVIKDSSIRRTKLNDNSISSSKIDETVASTSSLNDLNNRHLELNQRVTLVENGEIGDPFFKSFATLSEYETAVANGEVVYPCVSYITEGNIIKFGESPYNAIATVTQALIDSFGEMAIKPLVANPDYFEIFKVNGEDYLSNTTTFEGLNCIPFPSFNLGDTFEIKFKLKDEPQHFVENTSFESTFLFYFSLSYLEIDESFYNRVTIDMGDGMVKEYPVGFYMPSMSPDFTCKFKGDYGITDNSVSIESLSMIFSGLDYAFINNPDTPINWTFQIPAGNKTYGNPSDMFNGDTQTGATLYGFVNYFTEMIAGDDSINAHITIETY